MLIFKIGVQGLHPLAPRRLRAAMALVVASLLRAKRGKHERASAGQAALAEARALARISRERFETNALK